MKPVDFDTALREVLVPQIRRYLNRPAGGFLYDWITYGVKPWTPRADTFLPARRRRWWQR